MLTVVKLMTGFQTNWFCFNFIFTNTRIELLCWSPPSPIPFHISPYMCVQYRGGYLEYRGGYHEYRGGLSWVPWGDIMMHVGDSWVLWRVFSIVGGKSFVIWVPHDTEHPPRYSNFKGWYPPRYWTPSTVLMISPMVLNTPTVLMISPHGTEHPSRYSRYPPTFIMVSPTVLKISPHGHDIPHGTAHTLYRVIC